MKILVLATATLVTLPVAAQDLAASPPECDPVILKEINDIAKIMSDQLKAEGEVLTPRTALITDEPTKEAVVASYDVGRLNGRMEMVQTLRLHLNDFILDKCRNERKDTE